LRRHHDGPGISDDQRPGHQRAARRAGQPSRAVAGLRQINRRNRRGALLDSVDSSTRGKRIEPGRSAVGKIQKQASIAGRPELGIVKLAGICVAKMKPPRDTNSHEYFFHSARHASRRAPTEERNCQRERAALPSASLLPRLPEKLLSALTVLREI